MTSPLMVGVKTRDCLTLEEELRERRFTEHVMSDGCTSPLAAIPTHSCLQSIPMVSKLATHAVLLAATAACAWGASPFSRLSCPKSSPVNTGCYCTSGCSINGDTIFKWNAPLFPPKLLAAPEMGNDTICAISRSRPSPTLPAVALAAYLGITGDVYKNGTAVFGVAPGTEATIWTAFTQAECEAFVTRAQAAVAGEPNIGKLGVTLCNTERATPSMRNSIQRWWRQRQASRKYRARAPRRTRRTQGAIARTDARSTATPSFRT